MREIGGGFINRLDREALRGAAVPEAGDLREDEPHPMALLVAGAELAANIGVNRFLRIDEALEIKGV